MTEITSTAPFLELDQVSIAFRKKAVINNMSLKINQAEHLAILAPGHSGKSTLLKMMMGLVRPGSGSLKILGLDSWTQSFEVKRRCAYVPASPVYDGTLSVNDLLTFSASLGRDHADWDYVQTLADRFQVEPRKRIATLTPMEVKLVAFILAFMTHPEVVIMDEPYTNLDNEGRDIIMALLEECLPGVMTLIAAVTSPTQIGKIFKKVVLLQDGNLVSVVNSDHLMTQMVRKVEITFGTRPPLEQITRSGLVRQLSWEDTTLRCFVIGPSGPFLRTLDGCEILDIKSCEADLEEFIRTVYQGVDNAA
jgi:ABC-2 type transport system ATP-binding protein